MVLLAPVIRSALAVLLVASCATPPPAVAPRGAPSAEEETAWRAYLASVEAIALRPEDRLSGLRVLEVRARLAESLAALAAARTDLPRPLEARATRLLAALDLLFQRITRVAPIAVGEAPRAPAAAPAAAAPERSDPEPDAEISEAEVDDGGPPVDIVAPPPGAGLFRWPVLPVRVTSGFGYRRDPLSGRVGFHDGLDLSVARGSPIAASAGGRVTFAGWRRGSGNVVVVAHAPGVKTVYAHLDRILVVRGAAVAGGDVVGLAGSTGRATGPHLHFVVRMGGKPVNPMFVVGQSVTATASR
jgi:murein DD-endopeptidase MepM/ murein hydrolase activator NlpD